MSEIKVPKRVKVTAVYKSGRRETIHADLNQGGIIGKVMQKKIDTFESFPTITDVIVEKW